MREKFQSEMNRFSPNDSDFDIERTNSIPQEGESGAPAHQRELLGSRAAKFSKIAARLFSVLLLAAAIIAAPAQSKARVSVGIAVSFGPPALPVYYQPPCPGYGYIWTPGYWAWDPDYGYYWVPGTWVEAPFEGALWTPGYWDFDDGVYVWNAGFWGPVVGYYGGIDYGFGYTGYGYEGGYWRGDRLYYNRTVNNINTTNIRYVYNKTVVNNMTRERVSYNGGPGGTSAHATSQQLAASRMRRRGPVAAQEHQMQIAQSNPQQRANINHGRPAIAATARPGAFSGGEAVQATRAGAPYEPPKEMQRGHGAESAMPASPRHEHGRPNIESQPRGAERSMPAARPAPERSIPHETTPPRRQEQPHVNHSSPPHAEHVRPFRQRREPPPQAAHVNVQHARPERQPNAHAQGHKPPEQRRPERSNMQRAERPHNPGPPHGR